jgi:hypothetical protein
MKCNIILLFCILSLQHTYANSSRDFHTRTIKSNTSKNGLIFENPSKLAEVKISIARGSKIYSAALKQLIWDADTSLRISPVSVMEKTQLPASGNKHDYMSLARYYWPDTTRPNGLPYTERDGVVNPEIYSITDYNNFGKMNTAVHTLALAYYFTGVEKYAGHAAKLIRTWFLDPATKMNPNLNFAQAIKGVNDGRPTGLIETREIGLVGDAAGLIHGSKEWTEIDQKGLKKWFSAYLDWLLTSPNGKGEAKSINNHGVWFDVQITSVALFAGRKDVAKQILEESKSKRIEKEIEPDGSMPLELARTISKHYIRFTLEGFFRLATIGERLGIDLWNYNKNGRSLLRAIEYPIPFILGKMEWKFKQIYPFEWNLYYPLYLQASTVYKNKHTEYKSFLKNITDTKSEANRLHLILGE